MLFLVILHTYSFHIARYNIFHILSLPDTFKIESHWYDHSLNKLRTRVDYATTIRDTFLSLGLVQLRSTDPPGLVKDVDVIWGIHWENVFTTARGISQLKRHFKWKKPLRKSADEAFLGINNGSIINMIPGMTVSLCSKDGLARLRYGTDTYFWSI